MGLVQTAGYQGGSPRHVLQPQCWDAVLVEVERRNLAPGCASSGAVPLLPSGSRTAELGRQGYPRPLLPGVGRGARPMPMKIHT